MVKFTQRIRCALSTSVVMKVLHVCHIRSFFPPVCVGIFQTVALSLDARRQYSAGEITNFAVIDAARMTEHVNVMHLLFSLPIQVILSLLGNFGY